MPDVSWRQWLAIYFAQWAISLSHHSDRGIHVPVSFASRAPWSFAYILLVFLLD